MDAVLLLDQEGSLFRLEPPGELLTPVVETADSSQENSYSTRLNRIASSDWCFWAINSDFEIQLFVYERTLQVTVCMEQAEIGKGQQFSLPSDKWSWKNDWQVAGLINAKRIWLSKKEIWIRKRHFTACESYIHVESPDNGEFINDIALGGEAMSRTTKNGKLCVWVVSNCGRLFFRKNVSFSNPEGTDWLHVDLPGEHKALSVSCTSQGQLWTVTCEGGVLLRDGVDEERPFGQDWTEVKSEIKFIKISSSANLVYALDASGCVYFRTDTYKVRGGIEWKKTLKGLSAISVSRSNQVISFLYT